jgi:hypothetical protein
VFRHCAEGFAEVFDGPAVEHSDWLQALLVLSSVLALFHHCPVIEINNFLPFLGFLYPTNTAILLGNTALYNRPKILLKLRCHFEGHILLITLPLIDPPLNEHPLLNPLIHLQFIRLEALQTEPRRTQTAIPAVLYNFGSSAGSLVLVLEEVDHELGLVDVLFCGEEHTLVGGDVQVQWGVGLVVGDWKRGTADGALALWVGFYVAGRGCPQVHTLEFLESVPEEYAWLLLFEAFDLLGGYAVIADNLLHQYILLLFLIIPELFLKSLRYFLTKFQICFIIHGHLFLGSLGDHLEYIIPLIEQFEKEPSINLKEQGIPGQRLDGISPRPTIDHKFLLTNELPRYRPRHRNTHGFGLDGLELPTGILLGISQLELLKGLQLAPHNHIGIDHGLPLPEHDLLIITLLHKDIRREVSEHAFHFDHLLRVHLA